MPSVPDIARTAKKHPIFEPGETTRWVDLGRGAIERLVPHRDPFLLVDRITAVDIPRGACIGIRAVPKDDPVFRGHFPGHPVYPGVLLLETMGQLACCLASLLRLGTADVPPDARPAGVRALKIHSAVFQAAVPPGAELAVIAKVLELDELGAVCAGQILLLPAGAAGTNLARAGGANASSAWAGAQVATFSTSEVHFVEA